MSDMRPIDLADLALAGPKDQDGSESGYQCRMCSSPFTVPPDLAPSSFCNPCAHDVAERLAVAYIELAREKRVIAGAAPPMQSDPVIGPEWQPPGGLARRGRGLGRRRK